MAQLNLGEALSEIADLNVKVAPLQEAAAAYKDALAVYRRIPIRSIQRRFSSSSDARSSKLHIMKQELTVCIRQWATAGGQRKASTSSSTR